MYFLIGDFEAEGPSNPQVYMEDGKVKFFEDLLEIESFITSNNITSYFIGLYDEEFTDIEALKHLQDVPARQ